jgi:hypothetical protein
LATECLANAYDDYRLVTFTPPPPHFFPNSTC